MHVKLRVALVLETSGGGSGRHVLDLASGLTAEGHDVTVIWSSVRAEAAFGETLVGLPGVRNHVLSMRREVGPADVASLRALAHYLQAHGPFDVIHGHSSKAGALVRLLPTSVRGARIYTPHAFRTMDPTLRRAGRLLYGGVESALARRTSRVIAVSAEEFRHARSLGFPLRGLRLVVNGVTPRRDVSRDAARAEMGLTDEALAVGFVGRLEPQKNPFLFVDAIRLAQARSPRLVGVVIGDGPMRGAAETRAGDARVRFLGWRDAAALMNGLDVFCMTSAYEAMSYALLEAIHAGLPIITTRVGGVEETVVDGENGVVVPVTATPDEIAGVLGALAADCALRRRWSVAALSLAARRTTARMVKETLAVYREAILEATGGAQPGAERGALRPVRA
jgi:glycosyltransferase involved in cell wall biosynthesis